MRNLYLGTERESSGSAEMGGVRVTDWSSYVSGECRPMTDHPRAGTYVQIQGSGTRFSVYVGRSTAGDHVRESLEVLDSVDMLRFAVERGEVDLVRRKIKSVVSHLGVGDLWDDGEGYLGDTTVTRVEETVGKVGKILETMFARNHKLI